MIYVEIHCAYEQCEHLRRRGRPRWLGEALLAKGTGVRLLCIAYHQHTLMAVANPERVTSSNPS